MEFTTNRLWKPTFLIIPYTYGVKVTETGKEWACVKTGIRRYIQFASPAFLGRFHYAPMVLHVFTMLLSRCLLLEVGTFYWYLQHNLVF